MELRSDPYQITLVLALAEYVRQIVGLELSVIIWAFCGAYFGTGFSPKTGTGGALLSYVFSSMLSALLATGIEHIFLWKDITYTQLSAAAVAVGFYPLLAESVKHTSTILKLVLSKIGLTVSESTGDSNERH